MLDGVDTANGDLTKVELDLSDTYNAENMACPLSSPILTVPLAKDRENCAFGLFTRPIAPLPLPPDTSNVTGVDGEQSSTM